MFDRRHLVFACALVFAVLTWGPNVSALAQPAAEQILEEFPIADDNDFLIVPVDVGPRRIRAIVDTGCSHLVYDESLRDLLGERRGFADAYTALGKARWEMFDAPRAKLGRLDMENADNHAENLVACQDLGHIRAFWGEDIRAVIGRPFLRQRVVRLDFNCGTMYFLTSSGPDAGRRLPIRVAKGRWFVPATIDGIGEIPLELDTGFIGVAAALHPTYVTALEAKGVIHDLGRLVTNDVATQQTLRKFRGPALTFGGLRHAGLVFRDCKPNTPSSLGLSFLTRYIITFDFPNDCMYVKPSKHFNKPSPDDVSGAARFGIYLKRQDGGVFIERVEAGSAAEASRIRAADALLAIDGRDVSRERFFVIHTLFMTNADSYHVKMRRGTTEFETRMTIRRPSAASTIHRHNGAENKTPMLCR